MKLGKSLVDGGNPFSDKVSAAQEPTAPFLPSESMLLCRRSGQGLPGGHDRRAIHFLRDVEPDVAGISGIAQGPHPTTPSALWGGRIGV